MLAVEAAFRPERAQGVDCVIDLTLEGLRFHIVVRDQVARCIPGTAEDPDVVAVSDSSTLMEIGDGARSIDDAIDDGDLKVRGSKPVLRRFFTLFSLTNN